MQAPFICDYQTSNLTITIKDTAAVTGLPPLVHQSTYNGHNRIITETFDSGLLANHTYTLTITASDSTFADDVSTAAVNFSKHACTFTIILHTLMFYLLMSHSLLAAATMGILSLIHELALLLCSCRYNYTFCSSYFTRCVIRYLIPNGL